MTEKQGGEISEADVGNQETMENQVRRNGSDVVVTLEAVSKRSMLSIRD